MEYMPIPDVTSAAASSSSRFPFLKKLHLPNLPFVHKQLDNSAEQKIRALKDSLKGSLRAKGNIHLGKLNVNINEVVQHWDMLQGYLEGKIENLSGSAKTNALNRLAELKEMVDYAQTLQQDAFKPEVIHKLVNYRLELKSEGISDSFPKQLTGGKDGLVQDENGKLFDTLREYEAMSSTSRFDKFCKKRGGDYDYIRTWYVYQGGNAWTIEPIKAKHILAGFRTHPLEYYYWAGNPIDQIPPAKPDQEETLLMFLAFNMEFLTHTDLPGKEGKSITLYRVQDKIRIAKGSAVSEYQIGDKVKNWRRAAYESGSLIAPVAVAGGGEVTEQQIPLHRIVGTYITQPLHYNTEEKEFMFFFDGEHIPITYKGNYEDYRS
jgi:hypothetical protein